MEFSTNFRHTWAEVNLTAIKENMKMIRQSYPNKRIYVAVKANAYGHGYIPVSEAALEAGADALAVASLDEAILLRDAFPEASILVMGWTDPRYVSIAVETDIQLTAFQAEWFAQAASVLKDKQEQLKIHIKIDSGMGRIGIKTKEEAYAVIEEVTKFSSEFEMSGIFTHFATADSFDLSYYEKQMNYFYEMLEIFSPIRTPETQIHIGNTAASIRFPDDMVDGIRFGIGLYGLYPSKEVEEISSYQLKEAFSLQSRLAHVKKMKPGEHISYGATYEAEQEEWIGTVPIGYGDGWIRKLQGFEVLIEGEKSKIVGRICMDQLMVRLPKAYPVGTKVTLIGENGGQRIRVDDVADYLETINYEIPCIITNRVPRVYLTN
ncbi:alanine racemase [Allobacillus sp. GCM10007491]|uniref:Alanine racemase n=1 Tax=Allobacillus saliphilus TaxID=2912308 RepID=A0A941CVJ0_9BACI|nr:alanine racemase [Allobacillus saliphilus]MBR7554637.1 alanine racemase [Allobacillus saliphilus]